LDAALELIDREGAAALTMRRLGAELDVEAMSLYRHVPGRDALLDGISEVMMQELRIAPATGDWTRCARSFATGIRGIARRHPEAFALVGLRALNTPDALRPIEVLLRSLRDEGFTPAEAVGAYRLLASFARGYALIEMTGFTLAPREEGASSLRIDGLPAKDFPVIHELSRQLTRGTTDAQFTLGLDTIIAGLQAKQSH
jgi:AcrR family transcriptional regulator